VGTVDTGDGSLMVAFDASGAVRWTVGGYTPQIATADGGVIATDDSGNAVTFDQNGSASGQLGILPTYSWKGAYQLGSVISVLPVFDIAHIGLSFAAAAGGNLTGNGFYIAHHTFGLVFCGPTDGNCSGTTNVTFSYLAGINDQNYGNAVDFSQAYKQWVDTIKGQAYYWYKKAFTNLPAIVKARPDTGALYGCSNNCSVTKFEHTVYISGYWMPRGQYPRNTDPYPPNGYTPTGSGFPVWSWVYYLPIMGNAQTALGTNPPQGSFVYFSPTYPPNSPAVMAEFNTLMTAIGRAIGNVSAHETGHQLPISSIDCDSPSGIGGECESDYVYESYASGSLDWWFKDVPGKALRWSHDATCAIESYLLGKSYVDFDKTCPVSH